MAGKLLLLDLERANAVSDEPVNCAYMYHPGNDGLQDLREMATFALYCRHCEDKPCVKVCVNEALEKQDDGTVVRHNLRCVGCESCVAACPFGVISPAIVSYISSVCDLCAQSGDDVPPCVESAPKGVLQWVDDDDPALQDSNVHVLSERLAVRCRKWEREPAAGDEK